MRITALALMGKKGEGEECRDLQVFRQTWPDGIEVTEANLAKAAELGLNVHWFGVRFLPKLLLADFKHQEVLLWDKLRSRESHLSISLWLEFDRQLALLIWQLWPKEEVKCLPT